MAINIPGLNLSILRQDTTVQSGKPLLISGRFTVFGMGFPAFIRVILEGPSYDPQRRSFDAFASPFSGDYSINVVAEKDGAYNVYAQAFPPPAVPSNPLVPEAIILAPPFAESSHPPLAVGIPINGNVQFTLPDGSKGTVPVPPQSPIEFRPIIEVGAPGVSVVVGGAGGGTSVGGFVPPPPGAPPLPEPGVAGAAARSSAIIEGIAISPDVVNPGATATGRLTWINTGSQSKPFILANYLVDEAGIPFGPLQVSPSLQATPNIPNSLTVRMPTVGLHAGVYGARSEVYEAVNGALVASYEAPDRLTIRQVSAPSIPVPEAPPLPEAPSVPSFTGLSAGDLGTPVLDIPRSLTVGDNLVGSISLPTAAPALSFLSMNLALRSPTGAQTTIAQAGQNLTPGQPLYTPINYPTSALTAGTYNIVLQIRDQAGNVIQTLMLGTLNLLEKIPLGLPELPTLPTAPTLPTLPSAQMIGTPTLNAPRQLTQGDRWSGNISIPTMLPAGIPAPPVLPSYGLGSRVQLRSPGGQTIDVANLNPSFQPGQPISLPFDYDTSRLPEPGSYNVLLALMDPNGKSLFSQAIGQLQLLAAAVPKVTVPTGLPAVPTIPKASSYTDITIDLTSTTVVVGQSVTVPITYTHVGAPESASMRVSIGDLRGPVYDEVWYLERTIQVPLDAASTRHKETFVIPITQKLAAAGTYTVEAKVNGVLTPKILTRSQNVVRVTEPAQLQGTFSNVKTTLTGRAANIGDTIDIPVQYTHVGPAENIRLYVTIGQDRGFFDQVLQATKDWVVPLETTPRTRVVNVPIQITSAIQPGLYGVQVKIQRYETGKGDVISPPVYNLINITPGFHAGVTAPSVGASTLTATSSLRTGDRLSFSFTGFQANQPVQVSVAGGGGLSVGANGSGAGSGGFNIGEQPGTYTLQAQDQFGHRATAQFTVIATTAVTMPTTTPTRPSLTIGEIVARTPRITRGSLVFVDAPVTNNSSFPVSVSARFKFYEGSRIFTTHGTLLYTTGLATRNMQPGESFTFTGARRETSEKDTFDVGIELLVNGQVVASREDDDVYQIT